MLIQKRQSQSRNLVIYGCRFRLFWAIQLRIQRVFKTSSCRAVEAIAAKCVLDGKTPRIAVGIMQDGKAVLEQGYGMANLEHKVPARPETVFRIASMTKQFTAKPEYRSFRLQSHTISELLNWIKPDPYVAEPGAQYFYSNSGYLMLAGIIEKVSGRSFRDFLKGRVFDRLDKNTGCPRRCDANSKSGSGICSSGRSV